MRPLHSYLLEATFPLDRALPHSFLACSSLPEQHRNSNLTFSVHHFTRDPAHTCKEEMLTCPAKPCRVTACHELFTQQLLEGGAAPLCTPNCTSVLCILDRKPVSASIP